MSQFTRKILESLGRKEYRPLSAPELAQDLNTTKKNRQEFSDALEALLNSGQVRRSKQGLLRLSGSTAAGLIQGVIKKTAAGAGFLIPRNKPADGSSEDIYIAPSDLGDAHTGDEVLVQLHDKARTDGRPRGRIVEILQRSTRTFVGTYFEREDQGWVQVDGTTLSEPIFVGDPGAKGAATGDKVVFEMVRFPSQFRGGEGVLTEVLGPRGQPGVDTLSIIHEFGIPDAFPDEVLEDARQQAERFSEEEIGDRLDLTAETIVTIDPVDARDFDDAISLHQSEDGHWHLGVHIADVSHFVREGSPLDEEAYKRGTSVYLPDRVVPMLPELISNSLASLQQGKVRFTMSALMEFTSEGIPVHSEFARSAIKVTKRFAYEEVMPIIEEPERHKTRVTAKVRQLLQKMHTLAMKLRARRFAMGALELNMPEVKIDFDKQGKVTGAHVTPHDPSHQIIEEFMLAANMAVATALQDRGIPFLRRAHADPDEVKLRTFAEFVTSLGFPLKRYQSRLELQKLLDQVHASPHMHAVNYALLRSLKQAEYTPEEIGHYALAAENYCHFTSPIRRYPDLMVHRLLRLMSDGGTIPVDSLASLTVSGQHCSRTERRAEQAERELVKVKLLTYMQSRVGDEFEAIVTGVQDFGFFCQMVEVPAEGLVHVSTLDDDHYYFDQAAHTLVGRRSGRQVRLGSRIKVVVALVDVDRRQLDLRLAGSRAARAVQQGIPAAPRPGSRTFPIGGRPGPMRPAGARPGPKFPEKSGRAGGPPSKGKGKGKGKAKRGKKRR